MVSLANAGTGALTGASFGSMIPGIGTGLGAGIGGLLGFLGFGGSKENKLKKLPTMSPQQNAILNSLLGQLGNLQGPQGGYGQATSLLQQYLNPESPLYQSFEEPYLRQFEQQTLPSIAERFAGKGALGGGLSSSGFAQALGGAAGNLQSDLAALKTGMQRQSALDLLSQFNTLSNLGLGSSPFGYLQQPGNQGFFPSFASNLTYGDLKSVFGRD